MEDESVHFMIRDTVSPLCLHLSEEEKNRVVTKDIKAIFLID